MINIRDVNIESLEVQVREFCDRISRIKQLLQEKENKCNFAVAEGSQNCD